MDKFKAPTEAELQMEYADMLQLYAEKGQAAVESHILAKGRLEMQHLLAYLFSRAAIADIALHNLKEEINGTNQPQHTG